MHCTRIFFLILGFVFTALMPADVLGERAQTRSAQQGFQDGEPHLIFRKSVAVKEYDGGQAHTERHVIKPGDHLWKILREQYGISDTGIKFFCTIARALNPDIEDINLLQPDQQILIPFKFVPGDGSDSGTIATTAQDLRHAVRHGEHLADIMRTRFNLPDNVIFNRITISLIKDANPDITDLNLLTPGQTITIPREIFAMHQVIEHDALPRQHLQVPEMVWHADESAHMSDSETYDSLFADMVMDETPLTDEQREIKQVLSLMTRQFAGTDTVEGYESLSLDGDEALTLDYSRFPAFDFPWGTKVVLDFGERLPVEMRQVIADRWENAEIVTVSDRDDLETVIGRVLDVCGFYKIEKNADYTVNRDAVQLSISGNWIVFRDSSLRNVFVINLLQDDQTPISTTLRSYLADIGLEIMDIGAGSTRLHDTSDPRTPAPYTHLADGPAVLTDTILSMLNIEYETHYATSIFQNIYSDFSLEVIADRMFRKDGATYLIDFHNLPPRITDIITRQGFKLLQIDAQSASPSAIAASMLAFCNADFSPPPAKLAFNRGENKNIRLTVPGYVVHAPEGRKLLTEVSVNESIADFLREMDIEIIQF